MRNGASHHHSPVSIVIVSWNAAPFLKTCLESVRCEGGGTPCETIVVDNGSWDDTGEMLRDSFPDVLVIRNPTNLGFVKGCNQGLRKILNEGTSRFVVLVNSDVVVRDGALNRLAGFLEAHPEAAAAAPALILPNGELQPGPAGFRPTALSAAVYYSFLYKAWPGTRRTLFIDPGAAAREGRALRVDWLSGACLMVRREAVEAAGLMDEDYFLYADDIEWGVRMTDRGLNLYYLPGVGVEHFHGMTEKVIMKRTNTKWLACLFRYVERTRGTAEYGLFRAAAAAGFALRVVLQGAAAVFLGRPEAWAKASESARYLVFSLGGRARSLQ